ncbi:MAG: UDP-N-acetylmuramate dehydrogenase [Oscillospiraceae bacterium]|jgi:UDP-N-acetylmuramate dehydrogenase|nr:UDP-N-acetylmuramate dehydrogenase [Oscillospiraceae bacterium]
MNKLTEICRQYSCDFTFDASLKDYNTFKIGGNCSLLIDIVSAEAALAVLKHIENIGIKHTVIGNGSNIIVPDEGYYGVVLLFKNKFSDITVNGNEMECEAGASLKSACLAALENGLSGLEFAWGIPGTVGGALCMNAGAYHGEMSDAVVSAVCSDKGEPRFIPKSEMALSYRNSVFVPRSDENTAPKILKVTFNLTPKAPEKIEERMNLLLKLRTDKQPLDYPSLGSTFKRPAHDVFAAALIQECGLKGMSIGGAQVSWKHSGFIVNTGGATAKDLLTLAGEVQRIVFEKTGHRLELEPRIIE